MTALMPKLFCIKKNYFFPFRDGDPSMDFQRKHCSSQILPLSVTKREPVNYLDLERSSCPMNIGNGRVSGGLSPTSKEKLLEG